MRVKQIPWATFPQWSEMHSINPIKRDWRIRMLGIWIRLAVKKCFCAGQPWPASSELPVHPSPMNPPGQMLWGLQDFLGGGQCLGGRQTTMLQTKPGYYLKHSSPLPVLTFAEVLLSHATRFGACSFTCYMYFAYEINFCAKRCSLWSSTALGNVYLIDGTSRFTIYLHWCNEQMPLKLQVPYLQAMW